MCMRMMSIVLLLVGFGSLLSVDASDGENATDNSTSAPTMTPTATPTASPTASPTAAPTEDSSGNSSNTDAPTSAPTSSPTTAPTSAPTNAPTGAPTNASTNASTVSTDAPTASPTVEASIAPTAAPTSSPTRSPTLAPTAEYATVAGSFDLNVTGNASEFVNDPKVQNAVRQSVATMANVSDTAVTVTLAVTSHHQGDVIDGRRLSASVVSASYVVSFPSMVAAETAKASLASKNATQVQATVVAELTSNGGIGSYTVVVTAVATATVVHHTSTPTASPTQAPASTTTAPGGGGNDTATTTTADGEDGTASASFAELARLPSLFLLSAATWFAWEI